MDIRKKILPYIMAGVIGINSMVALPACKLSYKTKGEQEIVVVHDDSRCHELSKQANPPLYEALKGLEVTFKEFGVLDKLLAYGREDLCEVDPKRGVITYNCCVGNLNHTIHDFEEELPTRREVAFEELVRNLTESYQALQEKVPQMQERLSKHQSLMEERQPVTLDELVDVNDGQYVTIEGIPMDLDIKTTFKGSGDYEGRLLISMSKYTAYGWERGTLDVEGEEKQDMRDGYVLVIADEDKRFALVKPYDMTELWRDYHEIRENLTRITEYMETSQWFLEQVEQHGVTFAGDYAEGWVQIETDSGIYQLPPPGFFDPVYERTHQVLRALHVLTRQYQNIITEVDNTVALDGIEELSDGVDAIGKKTSVEGIERLAFEHGIDQNHDTDERRTYRIVGRKTTVNGMPAISLISYEISPDTANTIEGQVITPY